MGPPLPRVLLLHHDPARARDLAGFLREKGFASTLSADAGTARILAAEDCDVLVLDLDLAGPGRAVSASLVRSFRSDPRTARLPLLALADRPMGEGEAEDALAAGASDVLAAPFSPALLGARVGNLVSLHREERRLEETESRYRRLFDSSHYGYFLSSREGRFLEVNEALVRMLGYGNREEVLRLRLPEDLYVHPEEREVMRRMLERRGFVKDFRLEFRRKGGEPMTVLLTVAPYRSADGSLIGFEGVNIPLLDLSPSPAARFLARLLGPLARRLPPGLARRQARLAVARIGELVADRFEKTEELSEGFTASVWKGRDILGLAGGPLVIKVARSEAVNPRFLLEARALRELAGHPGVPELLEVARHRGRVVLVTRYTEGVPLSAAMDSLTPRDRDRVAFQLADTVAWAHEHDLVHRDVKPENVVLRPDGRVMLLDFGIVRRLGEEETSATVIGTRPYMSPEQLNGKSERRSDVWALGVLLYRLYTGRLPFEAVSEVEQMELILKAEPPTPRALNPALSARLEVILIRALRKRPEGRFSSAGELRDALLDEVPGFRENVADLIRFPEVYPPLVP